MAHEDEFSTSYFTLSVLQGTSAVFPPEAQPSAHDAVLYRLLEKLPFSVCERRPTLFQDRLNKDGSQSIVARGGEISAELLLDVRTPHGVNTWGESFLIEVSACDLGNRTFHCCRRRFGRWFSHGQSDIILERNRRTAADHSTATWVPAWQ
jgi:hypothetical protein